MDTAVIDRDAIEARVQELRGFEGELRTLEGVLNVLDGKAPEAPQRNGGGKPRSTSATATRAPRGSRATDFVDAVERQPGIEAKELADALDMNVNYVYKIAKEVGPEGSGKVEKRGKGFYLKDAEDGDGDKGGTDAE